MTGRRALVVVALLALAACADDGDAETGFSFERAGEGQVVEVSLLRTDRQTGPHGIARVDADVLLPPGLDPASARATLSHLIDSVAAADSMVAAVRLTGFVIGPLAPGEQEAPVNPVIQALWAPVDSATAMVRPRGATYRTQFTILGPLDGRPH